VSAYPYPPDEFDARADSGAPIGVHRARPSRWSQIWPFVVIGLATLATALTLLMLNTRYGGDAGPAIVGGADGIAGTALPTEVPEAAVDTEAAVAEANLNAHVIVLNDRAPNGEAGRGRDALVGEGFTVVEAETATAPTEHEFTTVLFRPGYDSTARAVAAVLNVPVHHMLEDEAAPADVVVVLRSPIDAASEPAVEPAVTE